jgi:phosphohistidine phosphatase SixA
MTHRIAVLVTFLLACTVATSAFAQDDTLLAALRSGGHVGLMRHARAPGSDDPPEFRLGDCATQRNLSAAGRTQATEIGEFLRSHGFGPTRIVSSQWCRCRDTAELLALGPVEELPALNSLVSYPREGRAMTADVRAWILAQDLSEPLLLVTHQVNIGALVREYPDEGEIIVVKPAADGTLDVLGTIRAVAPPR